MKILFLLIPLSLLLLVVAVGAFFWAVRSGQFDDLESPGHRILLDEDDEPEHGADRADEEDQRPGQP